jgi:hypothetical protein
LETKPNYNEKIIYMLKNLIKEEDPRKDGVDFLSKYNSPRKG